ncbi:hypothetical protein EMPG_09858 [Blastomyces silverae]|uniref:Uncharacterized protein n=1 Tax=Blastomyces silverae TaxID=2060906 RepID=A0A0H1BH77_9EURO|nr:hypothetical protein EMPG_09858 [Blastomyces silverae]
MSAWGTLRGGNLCRVDDALLALQEDPDRLARTRQRFSESPPPYRADYSHNSTLSQSPNPRPIEEQLREEEHFRLMSEHRASLPSHQFEAQVTEERERIIQAGLDRTEQVPVGIDYVTLAKDRVRKQWVEQGIWSKKWDRNADGLWKHEEPLVLDSESDNESQAPTEPINQSPLFFKFPRQDAESIPGAESDTQHETRSIPLFQSPINPRPAGILFGLANPPAQTSRQPENRNRNCNKDQPTTAERRATLEREREASRPFYQFNYQLSREREKIQRAAERADVTPTAALSPDINTKAYERVKATWIRRKIWNTKWGIMPGMVWKHEEPLETLTTDLPSNQVSPPRPANDRHDAEESPRPLAFDLLPSTFDSPSEPEQPINTIILDPNGPVSGHQNAVEPLRTHIISPVLSSETDDRQTPDRASPPRRESPHVSSNLATPRRRDRPPVSKGETVQSRMDIPRGGPTQRQPPDRTILGTAYPKRVTRSSAKKRPTPWRKSNHLDELPAAGPSSVSGASAAHTPLRRSKRLEQKQESNATENPAEDALIHLPGKPQTRPTRASASKLKKGTLFAETQGASKQKRSSTSSNQRRKKVK